MTLGNKLSIVSVWHRLALLVPADVALHKCKGSAGVAAAEAVQVMVCEKVAKMTQLAERFP